MASAKKINSVLLELTSDEAQTLYDFLYYSVGGSPENTRRKYVEYILQALLNVGITYSEFNDMHGSAVYFK